MAWKSGIWNALPKADGEYDRKYNGDDYSDPLGYIIGNGIVTNTKIGNSETMNNGTALQVSNPVVSGATYGVTIKSGWGWINGKWFCNPTDDNTSIVGIAAPTQGNKRYDRLVVRRDNRVADGRLFYPVLIQGTQVASGTPSKPAYIREEPYYDLVLADILVTRGDTISVSITDTRSNDTLCGFCNGYFGDNFDNYIKSLSTVFNASLKELQNRADNWVDNNSLTQGIVYKNKVVLTSATNTVSIGISSYQHGVDTLEIYTNGQKEYETTDDFTADYVVNSDGTVTFTETKAAGAEIYFEVTKYVDGTEDVSQFAELTAEIEGRVEKLEDFSSEYNYMCNEYNDNIALSNLVNNFLKADLTDYSMKKINIYGTFGMTEAYNGTGQSNNAYKWINFANTNGISNRKVILDFSNCSELNFPITAGTNNILFYFGGNEVIIQGANFLAQQTGSNTTIQGVYATAKMALENCRGWISCYNNLTFAERGRYDNCRVNCTSSNGNVTIFNPTGTDFIEVNGGEYYAYMANGTYSAVVYHSTDAANAVTILNGVRMPTSTRSGYSQSNATRINNGYLSMTNCVTALSNTTAAAATVSNIGTIPISR